MFKRNSLINIHRWVSRSTGVASLLLLYPASSIRSQPPIPALTSLCLSRYTGRVRRCRVKIQFADDCGRSITTSSYLPLSHQRTSELWQPVPRNHKRRARTRATGAKARTVEVFLHTGQSKRLKVKSVHAKISSGLELIQLRRQGKSQSVSRNQRL